MNLISKQEAVQAGEMFYFTGKPCKHGHVSKRYTNSSTCWECHRNRTPNPAVVLKASKAWNARNKKQQAVYRAEFYSDPENKQAFLDKCKEYRDNNRDKYAAHCRKRQAAKLNRTPSWLTEEDNAAIAALYAEAQRLTEETGTPHVVDHIIPLQGKIVSGLHVPSNLQILTQSENSSKGNTFTG